MRRDGHDPIIFMQCEPIRYRAARSDNEAIRLEVWPRLLNALPAQVPENGIQEVFRSLASDHNRNQIIARDIIEAYREGHKIIVLTERTEHLERLRELLDYDLEHYYVLHGRLPKKQRAEVLAAISNLDDSAPRVILATGRLIGQGFDHPPLDTLVLALPISWKGTIQQYAGRFGSKARQQEGCAHL